MGYKDLQVLLLLLFGVWALAEQGAVADIPAEAPLVQAQPPLADNSTSPPAPNSGTPPPMPTSFLPPAVSNNSTLPSPSEDLPSPSTVSPTSLFETNTSNMNKMMLKSRNEKFSFNLVLTKELLCAARIQHIPSNTIVWVANFMKKEEAQTTKCFLNFTAEDLVLANNKTSIWKASESGLQSKPLDVLELDDTGCLSLKKNGANSTAWNSFDHPSDIIITGQQLKVGNGIYAAQSGREYFSENLTMRVDRNQVLVRSDGGSGNLFTVSKESEETIGYIAMQNGFRVFAENNSILYSNFNVSYERDSLWEYARLDPSGHLVIASYVDVSHQGSSNGGNCSLPAQCESYGILCSETGKCECLRGFIPVESSSGFTCQRNGTLNTTRCLENNFVDAFVNYNSSGFITNSSFTAVKNFEECESLCSSDCNCTMALYVRESGKCHLNPRDLMQKSTTDIYSPLLPTRVNNIESQTLFLRIVNDDFPIPGAGPSTKSSRRTAASAFAGGAGVLAFVLLAMSAWFLYFKRRRLFEEADNGKYDSAAAKLLYSKPLPQFTYQELVESTGNFAQKLGSGGFSCVYAGHLPDNTKIAVKKLDDNEHKENEFLAAVETVGSISHDNLVSLRGFCKEGQHRILVYELVNEGRSLNWYLFPLHSSSPFINAQTRRNIALGAARGLAHLHEDSNSSIVLHGGVKPENIVIDRRMHPRLVDFGLLSLMSPDQRLSDAQMRGSCGYMAPEWVKSQPITEKVDVYSLGIVILELVSGRRCLKQCAGQEKCFLPTWGFSLLRRSDGDPDCILELVDPHLDSKDLPGTDQQVLKGMIYVALWCVQGEVGMRPPMKEVVRMLAGEATVETPPFSPALDAFARELCAGCAGERAPESSNNSFTHSNSLKRNSDMLTR